MDMDYWIKLDKECLEILNMLQVLFNTSKTNLYAMLGDKCEL